MKSLRKLCSAVLTAMLLLLAGGRGAQAAAFQDTQVGRWQVYHTAVRGANACQMVIYNVAPDWDFNVAIYDNAKGPLIDVQALHKGGAPSSAAAPAQKIAASLTIDGKAYMGEGQITGIGITSYDSLYQGAAAAALAARLAKPMRRMTLAVGDETITAPVAQFNTAFSLIETCYPLWIGRPLAWRAKTAAEPAHLAPAQAVAAAARTFSLNTALQEGFVIKTVTLVPGAEARAMFNSPALGALAVVTLQRDADIAVCTLSMPDWVYTNPRAFAGAWCRKP